mgnify:CR=1 FL=1
MYVTVHKAIGRMALARRSPLLRAITRVLRGCGICVDPESVDEIREALNWFLKNPIKAKKMGSLGRQIVLDRLSWQSEEIKLLNMYREVL